MGLGDGPPTRETGSNARHWAAAGFLTCVPGCPTGWKEDAAGSRRPPGANGAAGGEHTSVPAASAAQGPREPGSAPLLLDGELDDGPASESLSVADGLPAGALLHVPHLTGWGLWLQQFRALFIKRLLCARRDRLAALVQARIRSRHALQQCTFVFWCTLCAVHTSLGFGQPVHECQLVRDCRAGLICPQ